jgi:CUG-BP- and ETR3-like factor
MLGVALLVGAVSAPPLIHPRPQISETPTPVKSAPLLPLTATSGPQGANLFVFGIPEDMGDKKLADLFSPYGSVVYAKVGVEKDTGRNRTYGKSSDIWLSFCFTLVHILL